MRGFFDTLHSIASKVFTYLASITLTGTDGSTLTVSGDVTIGQSPTEWTPGIAFGGASVGVTYHASNGGSYVKTGKVVVFSGRLILTSKGSSNGDAYITGLPFAAENNNYSYTPVSLDSETITFSGQMSGSVYKNTTTIELVESTLAGVRSTITDADFANTSELRVSGAYFTP